MLGPLPGSNHSALYRRGRVNYRKPASQGEISNDLVFVDFVFANFRTSVLAPNSSSKWGSHWQNYVFARVVEIIQIRNTGIEIGLVTIPYLEESQWLVNCCGLLGFCYSLLCHSSRYSYH